MSPRLIYCSVLLLGVLVLNPSSLFAEVVLKCSAPTKPKCRCLIEYSGDLHPVYRKNKVIINNKSGRWIKTGTVERVRGDYVVARFPGRCKIRPGFSARVLPYDMSKVDSYETAFE